MGRQVARDAESRLEIMKDPQAAAYVDALGKRLAAKAPGGQQYPFQFKIVNDTTINGVRTCREAFVYVNRALLETSGKRSAAGAAFWPTRIDVTSCSRHGTNQILQSLPCPADAAFLFWEAPPGQHFSITSVFSPGIGGGFTESSVLLRNSRDIAGRVRRT